MSLFGALTVLAADDRREGVSTLVPGIVRIPAVLQQDVVAVFLPIILR